MKLKKVFVLFLTLCMALSVMPFAAWAEEETDGNMPEPEIEEPTPVPEEPTPVPEEPTPVPEEPTPVPEEPTPVPEEPTPVPEEPTPAPEEPTPAPTEPTSAPAEPEYIPPKVLANGREYLSLSEALADVGDGEFEVIFLDDLSENAEVGKNQSITLILADCSFSGEIINYGKLTVFGSESGFDGCIITRAYCEKDEDGNVVDEASGETVIEDGSFNGELILEQKSDARVSADAQPKLRLNSGRFGVDLTKRYLNWDEESSEPEYSASAGSIEITGGVYFSDPSAYVAEGYASYAYDGWWLVGPKTEGDDAPTAGEDNPSLPGAEIYIDTDGTDSTAASVPEVTLPAEKKPVKQEEKVVLIDVDVNITGSGSVVFEGDEYGKGSQLKFVAYSEPVLEIRPAENWKISNVTVGTNGSAIPFGTDDTIQLPPLVNYATVNVTFTQMPANEAKKAENNAENSASESGDLTAVENLRSETRELAQKSEEKPANQVEVAVNITGEGTVLLDGKEYKDKDSLSLPEFSSPKFTIQPAENWKIYNVTIGANGSATPCGTESEITIDSLAYFSTLNIVFAEMKPEEIEALKAEKDGQEENSELEENLAEEPEKQTDEEKSQIEEEKTDSQIIEQPMLTAVRPKLSSAKAPLEAAPLLEKPSGEEPNPEVYHITYEKNGGDFAQYYLAPETFTVNDEVRLPGAGDIVDPNGGIFSGWYVSESFGDESESISTIAKNSKGDRTYYAKWKYIIEVSLDDVNGKGKIVWNDGTGDKDIKNSAEPYKITAFTKSREEFKFVPYDGSIVSSVIINGTEAENHDNYIIDKVSKNETIQMTLGTGNTYTVTFNYDNGGVTPTDSRPRPANSEITLPLAVWEGHRFMGWERQSDGTMFEAGAKYTIEDVAVFKAIWEYEEYNLTYQSNGGTALDPVIFTINDTVPLSVPTQEGAVFEGWYLEPDCSGSAVTEIKGADYPHAVMVYAKWKYIMYSATYNYNDGTTPVTNEVKYGTTLTLPNRTRAGYDFTGWLCSADGKTYQAYTQYPVKSDVTFTAQWEKQRVFYKVSVYHTNNGVVFYNGQPLPSGSSFELEEGKTAELKFAATTSGYYVYNCTVNNVRRGSVDGLTVGPIKENEIISVTFAPTFVRPITGDANPLMLWACLMAASALGMAGTALLRKKRKAEKH